MRSPFARSSIGVLMMLIVACALGFAALRRPSLLWAGLFHSAVLLLLVISLIIIATRKGPGRAPWIGFAIAGGAHWLVAMGPWDELGPRLGTTALLDILYARLNAPEEAPGGSAGPVPGGAAWGNLPREARIALMSGAVSIVREAPEDRWTAWTRPMGDPDGTQAGDLMLVAPEPFRRIGHALISLVLGLAGAILATWSTRREGEGSPSRVGLLRPPSVLRPTARGRRPSPPGRPPAPPPRGDRPSPGAP